MTAMRPTWLKAPACAAAIVVIAALAACTGPDVPRPSRSAVTQATPSTEASSSAEAWDPGDVPDPSGVVRFPPAQRGDCPVDPAEPGLVAFVVTSDDDTTPIELTYPVFRSDGTQQVRRMTQPGPAVTVLQADCTDGVSDGPWKFVAEAATGSLACALFFGGTLVASDSGSAEGTAGDGVRADCTGHPGM